MRFPNLAKRIRSFSHEADYFLEQKWRGWSDIIDRKCRKLADFLDPPRKEPERGFCGSSWPYRPGAFQKAVSEICGQRRNRNTLLDRMLLHEQTSSSDEGARITNSGQEFKIPLQEYVVKCGHEYQPIGGIRMFEGAHEIRSS